MRYETAIRFLRLLKEHETFPAAACVARFWAQPPKYHPFPLGHNTGPPFAILTPPRLLLLPPPS